MLPTRSTGGTSSPRDAWERSWQNSDADVAELYLVAVILKSDVAFGRFAVVGHRLELAAGDFFVPFRRSELILEKLLSVEPVLDVIAVDDQSRGIPLACRMHDAARRGIESEVGPS